MKGKILPIDNLRKMGIIISNWWCMCKFDREIIDDLFLHCDVNIESYELSYGYS